MTPREMNRFDAAFATYLVALPVVIVSMMLGACTTPTRSASTRGACDVLDAPVQSIKGADSYSQRWADRTVEAGVSACGWKRPRATAKPTS